MQLDPDQKKEKEKKEGEEATILNIHLLIPLSPSFICAHLFSIESPQKLAIFSLTNVHNIHTLTHNSDCEIQPQQYCCLPP